ncbi:hypothetical protein LCGC14_1963250 [marine sediment metagenome]|uniref:Uncharacterized protein n=1 Tax=marine sediment metagenome TaxID=412755 RepID=A0A0F9FEA3_9ZZZZ
MGATTEQDFRAAVDDWVPLRKPEADIFAGRLQRYLEERVVGLKVTSVAFRLEQSSEVLAAHVKTERRKDNTVVNVVENIGGPEICLYVNDIRIATWMTMCDRLTTDMLDSNFNELAQVAMLALAGTWDLHNVTICCSRWGEKKSKTIECCTPST